MEEISTELQKLSIEVEDGNITGKDLISRLELAARKIDQISEVINN